MRGNRWGAAIEAVEEFVPLEGPRFGSLGGRGRLTPCAEFPEEWILLLFSGGHGSSSQDFVNKDRVCAILCEDSFPIITREWT